MDRWFFYYPLLVSFLAGCQPQKQPVENRYRPYSTTCIALHVEHLQDTLFADARLYTLLPGAESRSNYLEIPRNGIYHIQLSIDRPALANVALGESTFQVFLLPEDTVVVKINVDPLKQAAQRVTFSGRTASISQYYYDKQAFLGYSDTRYALNRNLTSKTTFARLAHQTDSLLAIEKQFLENYPKPLPMWFKEMEEANIAYLGAGFKLDVPVAGKQFKIFTESPTPDYYTFLQRIPINNSRAIWATHYFWFLDSYFLKEYLQTHADSSSGIDLIRSTTLWQLAKASEQLSGEVRDAYTTYILLRYFAYSHDLPEADSLIGSVKNYFFDPHYHQLLVNYRKTMEDSRKDGNHLSATAQSSKRLNPGDKAPYFYLPDSLNTFYGLDTLRNKVVYVSFWATWCGPCIKAFPDKQVLVEKFKDQPVAFVNICINDDKERWKGALMKYRLPGLNLYAEGQWQNKLLHEYQINGIPHYVLIDKVGNIYRNMASSPQAVAAEIEQLLSEI